MADQNTDLAILRNDLQQNYLRYERYRVKLGKTGAETCHENGLTCLFLSASEVVNPDTKEFWGYKTFSCDSRIVSSKQCDAGFELTGGWFTKAQDSTVKGFPGNGMCLYEPYWDYVYCVDTLSKNASTSETVANAQALPANAATAPGKLSPGRYNGDTCPDYHILGTRPDLSEFVDAGAVLDGTADQIAAGQPLPNIPGQRAYVMALSNMELSCGLIVNDAGIVTTVRHIYHTKKRCADALVELLIADDPQIISPERSTTLVALSRNVAAVHTGFVEPCMTEWADFRYAYADPSVLRYVRSRFPE